MTTAYRNLPSTRQRQDDDVEVSNLGRGEGLRFPRARRTLRPDDKILETSLSRTKLRDNQTQTDDPSVKDTPSPPSLSDDDDATLELEPNDRARSVLSLLLRKESQEILERVVSTDDAKRLGQILLSSHDVLHSFCRLVVDGGLTVSDGHLRTTALTDRILQLLPENMKS